MKKRNKILIIIGAILVVLLIIAQFYANSVLQKLIRNEINTLVEEQKNEFHIEVDKIKVQILLKRIVLSGIKVNSIDTIPTQYDNSFKIDLDNLVIKLAGITDIFKEGKLKLKSVELDQPAIYLTYKVKIDSLLESNKATFKSARLKEVQLASLKVINGQFHLQKYKDSTLSLVTTVMDTEFELDDIFLNLEETQLENKLSFSNIALKLGNVTYHDVKDHDISANELLYNKESKMITIGDLIIKNKTELAGYKGDFTMKEPWFDSKIEQLQFNLDFEKLKNKKLYFKHIDIQKLALTFYQNKKDSASFSIQELLNKIPFPLSIDSLNLKESSIDFSFVNKYGENDDYVVNKLHTQILHISNDSLYIDQYPIIDGYLSSKLWQEGSIDASFSYNTKSEHSEAKVTVNSFPERKLKNYFKKHHLGQLRSGKITKCSIEFASDSTHIEGNLVAQVNDFNLNYDQLDSDSKWSTVNASLATLLVKSSFYKNNDKPFDVLIDSLYLRSPRIDLVEKQVVPLNKKERSSEKTASDLSKTFNAQVNIQVIDVEKAAFKYSKSGIKNDLLSFDEFAFHDRSMIIDLSEKGLDKIIKIGSYSLNASHLEFFSATSHHYLSLKKINVDQRNDKIDIIGLRYKDKSSKDHFHASASEGNKWNSAYIEKVMLNIDLDKLLKKEVNCSEITIMNPILTHIEAIERADEKTTEKPSNNDFSIPISVDLIKIIDGDVDFRIKKEKQKEFEIFDLSHLNGQFTNLRINQKNNSSSSLLQGSLSAGFYNKATITVNIEHDFAKKKASTKISGKASKIPLDIVKERLSFAHKFAFNNGAISSINFNMLLTNKNWKATFEMDTLTIDKYYFNKANNRDWLSISVKQISSSLSKSEGKELNISKLSFLNPVIEHHDLAMNKAQRDKNEPRKKLFSPKSNFKKIAKLEELAIIDGKIEQFDGAQSTLFSIENLNLVGNNMEIYDSTNTLLPIAISELDIKLKKININNIPTYNMTIDQCDLNVTGKKMILKELYFVNKEKEDDFFAGLKYRKAWIELKVPELAIDVEMDEFFSTHPHISDLVIDKAVFTSLINLQLEVSPVEKPLPNRMLANSKFPITVDSIFVRDSQINIKFIDVDQKHGLLQFNDIDAWVSNLTSDPLSVKKNNHMIWDFKSTLWKSGKSHFVVDYELDSPNDDFSMYGKVDNMSMMDADTLSSGLYGITVNDGILYHSYFEIKGDNDEAGGDISFDYEFLKISLEKKKKNLKSIDELKKVKQKDKLNQSFVKSMIVNGLLSKKNVPDTPRYIPKGEAYYKREKNKPIFHLMWYTLSSGILEVAEAGVVKDLKNFNNFFKKKKTEDN